MATRKRKTTIQKRLDEADAIIEEQVEAIDEQLDKVERMMRPYEALKERENKLRAARRALLGGSRATGGGGDRLRQEDIVGYLKENPGAAAGQIAKKFGTTQTVVSSHLYRGKGERFLNKDGRWYLRSPKDGIDTVDDIEEEDE